MMDGKEEISVDINFVDLCRKRRSVKPIRLGAAEHVIGQYYSTDNNSFLARRKKRVRKRKVTSPNNSRNDSDGNKSYEELAIKPCVVTNMGIPSAYKHLLNGGNGTNKTLVAGKKNKRGRKPKGNRKNNCSSASDESADKSL